MIMEPYPIRLPNLSLAICFEVVPLLTREWKPDTAPQAISTKSMGQIGPCEGLFNVTRAGAWILGAAKINPRKPTPNPKYKSQLEM
jgi:hypothetical protein